MTDWIDISDTEAWEKRPNKIELLYPDGRIGELCIYPMGKDHSMGAGLIMDSVCLSNIQPTHWRPLPKEPPK